MDLQEAYFRQKDELHILQRENCSLIKRLEKAERDIATDERVQELLSKIKGLNNKISHFSGISDRYKALYENQKKISIALQNRISELETENYVLSQKVEDLEYEKNKHTNIVPEEADAQIAALKDEVARLSSMLNKDSSNAGIPTSKTDIAKKKRIPNSRVKSGLKKGGQSGHLKHEMKSFSSEEVTDTITHILNECPKCGSHNLEEVSAAVKDEYDYQVVVKKVRHKFIEYRCLDCGETFRAPYNGLVASNQYGSTIQSMALSLMNVGFVSINRTKKILSGLSSGGNNISEAYLVKLQKKYAKELSCFVSDVRERLLSAPLLYWDDTVVFVNTARACMRFYGNESLALYTAHMHKDLESLLDDGILSSLTENATVMHDHNTINYHQGFVFKNVECLQHLERDLQKITDISQHPWAARLKDLIESKIHRRKELLSRGEMQFPVSELEEILSSADDILKSAETESEAALSRYFSSDEKALIRRLKKYKSNYLEWIKDFSIPTTNNLSERSLRFVKTKDKVSGQFLSIESAGYFAAIRTYIETCVRNGISEFEALLRLTQKKPYTVAEILETGISQMA